MNEITVSILIGLFFAFILLLAFSVYIFATEKSRLINKKIKESNIKHKEFGLQEVKYDKDIPHIDSVYPTIILQFFNEFEPRALLVYDKIMYNITHFCFYKMECMIPEVNGLNIEIYGELCNTKLSPEVGIVPKPIHSNPIFIAHGIVGTQLDQKNQQHMLETLNFKII